MTRRTLPVASRPPPGLRWRTAPWLAPGIFACAMACTSGGGGAGAAPGSSGDAGDGAVSSTPLAPSDLKAAADAAGPDIAAFLSQLIQFPSVEPPEGSASDPLPAATESALQLVLDQGVALGMTARRSTNGRVGILEYGTGAETVGAVIHLDVVPAGDESAWEHLPFSGDVVEGEVWGRGAQDDKGAGVSMLWAAKLLVESKVKYPRRLRLIFGTSEEVQFSRDVEPYFAEDGPPDVGLVPDGPNIASAEAGYMDVAITFANAASTGAGRDRAVFLKGGQVVNAVPELAFVALASTDPLALRTELEAKIAEVSALVTAETTKTADLRVQTPAEFVAEHPGETLPPGDLVLSSKGVAFHSSVPQLGRNALVEVALVGARLSQLGDGGIARALRFLDSRIGLTVDGSRLGFVAPDAGLGTTLSVDLASTDTSVDAVTLTINCRRRPNVTSNDAILASLRDATADLGAEVGTLPGDDVHPGYNFPANDPVLKLLAGSYEEVLGEAPVVGPNPAASYVQADPQHLTLFGPVFGATEQGFFHSVNERTPVASLTRNVALYAHALQSLLLVESLPSRQR